ncbi:RNA polymerase factor sigma-54 [Salibacterium aidingense]|uniref:RNA polymerase factor sigma-54 n=1 Tax=Salibacterium aidingense TaxID=384933 RepID=UPI000419CE72|nr:RNA polymerase factor sigma-54 [Salibacterium aidingense]
MNLEMGLHQKQTMNLVMTQELRQAISLLQLSTLELNNYIEEAALENPLMEIEEQESPMREEPRYDMPVMWKDEPSDSQEYQDRDDFSPFDQLKDARERISDYLIHQIRLLPADPLELKLLKYLAGNVSDQGYLEGTYEETAAVFSISPEQYEYAVARLQSLEPAGVAARSLGECLLLQLERISPRKPLTEKVVSEHLEALGERNWRSLADKLGVTLLDIQAVYDDIQELDPHPGAGFGGENPVRLVPDVYVEREGERFTVRLHDEGLPRIRMNRHYRHLLEQKAEGEAAEYAKKKYKQLVWLLKSIDQRQQTIRSITEAIVEFQRDFFRDGSSAMKPLTLRDVAEEAEVHESTVSRTTTNKYVQTPHGLFELKYFFSAGMNNHEGEQTSTFAIKNMIKDVVKHEDKQKPLSDQKISSFIETEKGISVSRRAVAKYRDELSIPASSKRKRYM